jgi:hypothetical protein
MKGMDKISRGKGFNGMLSYAFEGEKYEEGHGRILGGNMAGRDKTSLANEFKAIANLRPDIAKPVWHSSLRMPKGEDVSDEKWQKIVDDYMQKMEWDMDNLQYVVFKHPDDHVHIIASRVLPDGKVYLGQNENLKSTRVIGELERVHGLTLTKGPDRDEQGKLVMPEVSRPKKAEMEKALRTGEKPPRIVLQELVTLAMRGRPTTEQFMERLEAAGVDVLPNVASTGKMNGFSFRLGSDGLKFSGSELGSKFKWSAIEKGIDYEQVRDSEALTRRRDAEVSRRGDDRAAGPAPTTAGERIGTGVGDGADSPSTSPNPEVVTVNGREAEGNRVESPEAQRRDNPNAGRGIIGSENQSGTGDADTVIDPAEGARRIVEIAAPAKAKDVDAKVRAWREQHAALDAPAYRLTMKDRLVRDGKDRSHNPGKGKGDEPEKFFSPDEVERMIPNLRAKNARGFDVYITPIDRDHHYIVVDDMRPEGVAKLKAEGFQPALVQSSSKDNVQAIIKASRDDRKDEQQIANKLVVDLNTNHGDPKFSGVIHPFRMAGFSNKKPGKANAFTRLIEAAGGFCRMATEILTGWRKKNDQDAANAVAEEKKQARVATVSDKARHAEAGPVRGYQQQAYWLTRDKANPDWSSVDFGVCCEFLKKGYDREYIEKALRGGSPEIEVRHRDVERYVRETIDHAIDRVGSVSVSQKIDPKIKPK